MSEKQRLQGNLLKHLASAAPHVRRVWLNDDGSKLCWSSIPDEKTSAPQIKSVDVKTIIAIRSGKHTPLFQKKRAATVSDEVCFSVVSSDRVLDLQCESKEERDQWVTAIQGCVQEQKVNQVDEEKRQRIRKREQVRSKNLDFWESKVLPKWDHVTLTPEIKKLWQQGLPPKLRGSLWADRVGNELKITWDLYDTFLSRAKDGQIDDDSGDDTEDSAVSEVRPPSALSTGTALVDAEISQTFPELQVFQSGGPFHIQLKELLATYAQFRPDIGYASGISHIAALLLLNMEEFPAFVCLANILNRPHFLPFLRNDTPEILRRLNYLKQLIKEKLPELSARFDQVGISVSEFATTWLRSMFAQSLPIDIANRCFDGYLLEGEVFAYRFAIGLLSHVEARVLYKPRADCLEILTHLNSELDEDTLFESVQTIVIPLKT